MQHGQCKWMGSRVALRRQGQIHMAVVCQKGQKSAADPTPNQDTSGRTELDKA